MSTIKVNNIEDVKTLTIGDATAEDTKIVFDGNAQDFHIGLDDSADSLTIGLGSTLGTTSHMVFDANGHITKPLQPAFSAASDTTQSNIATGSEVGAVWEQEIFDQNSDFSTSSDAFTAPVSGRYLLGARVRMDSLDKDASYFYIKITTSNREYYNITTFSSLAADQVYFHFNITQLADMDANDTAIVRVYQPDGTQQADLTGQVAAQSFWGFLVA